jgi:hypothetical protein
MPAAAPAVVVRTPAPPMAAQPTGALVEAETAVSRLAVKA